MSFRPGSVLTVSGDAYNRGVVHGSTARELVHRAVAFYVRMWEQNTGRGRSELLQRAGEFMPMVAAYDGQIMQEIEGIAAGADLSVNEVLLVNARYELMMTTMFAGEQSPPMSGGECTSLAAAPQATSDGHTYVGQNWDHAVDVGQHSFLLEILQDDRPNIVTHIEAGFVGHKGLNAEGLGLCANAMASQHDQFAPKVPVWVLARGVLNAATIDEAIEAVRRADRAASINFTIGSDCGDVVALELTPIDVERVEPENGRIAHANVFCGLDPSRGVTDELAVRFPVFCTRAARVRELIDRHPIDTDALMEILQDHGNRPESICRHHDDQPPEAPDALRLETLSSVIMDLTERSLYITDGPPCGTPYQKHNFASLQKTR